jgi:hypothetical protein
MRQHYKPDSPRHLLADATLAIAIGLALAYLLAVYL